MPNSAAQIQRVIEQHDVFRGLRVLGNRGLGTKEWSHFCLHQPGLHCILNFSLVDEVRVRKGAFLGLWGTNAKGSGAVSGSWRWQGTISRAADAQVEVSPLALRLSGAALEFRNGSYRIELDGPELAARLSVTPLAIPYLANNVNIGDRATFNWFAVPRARAEGYLETQGERTDVDAACYHDRNWGHFGWGDDFSWEWAFSLPSPGASAGGLSQGDPVFVFSRMSDRARHHVFSQGILVWQGSLLTRAFRGAEVSVQRLGLLKQPKTYALPPMLRLVCGGSASDIPKTLLIQSRADGDELVLRCEMLDVARILVPKERGAGAVVISEVLGSIQATGRIGGQAIHAESLGNFEFLSH